jgi:hypothetical protein
MQHDNSHADPAAVETARNNWGHFTQLMKYACIGTAAVLFLMLIFIVN